MDAILNEEDRKLYKYGPYAVTIINNFRIPIDNKLSLAAKIWFPNESLKNTAFNDIKSTLFCKKKHISDKSCEEEKYCVVLEYLPYRKSDLTAQDDYGKYTWLASNGYVCMRVDIRGTGDSDGLITDEYSKEEQDDCLELFRWLEEQPWCTGKVAMVGYSWGGFNGLQMAYLQPPQLRTVISICSTDDRFITDVHYDGGCLTGDGMISWGTLSLAWNALPPDPRHVDNWQEVWKSRLKAYKPWMSNWLQHQSRDNYWKHGSINQNYSRVKCPVLLAGGWRDQYKDAIPRMLQNLKKVQAIIGPWGHSWPHTANQGPNIDFMNICLKWLDNYLKDACNSIVKEPTLRAYLQDYVAPTDKPVPLIPGKWVQFNIWPSDKINDQKWVPLKGNLRQSQDMPTEKSTYSDIVPFFEQFGLNYCAWVEMSMFNGPVDQSVNQLPVLRYSSDPMKEDMILFGSPEFTCKIKIDASQSAVLQAQLMSIDPKGRTTKITYGVKKLTGTNLQTIDHHTKVPCPNLVEMEVKLPLHAMSLILPKGHRISLEVSPNFWPYVWCSDKQVTMFLQTGIDENHSPITFLTLPTLQKRDITPYNSHDFDTNDIIKGKNLPAETIKEGSFAMDFKYDEKNKSHIRNIESYHGKVLLKAQNVITENLCKEQCSISEGSPKTACSQSEMLSTFEYQNLGDASKGDVGLNGNMIVKVHSKTLLTADERYYHLVSNLTATCNGKEMHTEKWDEKIDKI